MRARDLVLDAAALSDLLDERKPHHHHAQRVLLSWASSAAADPEPGRAPPFMVPSVALYEVRRGLLKVSATRRLRDLDRFLRAYARIVAFDGDAADVAARLWADRSRAGQPAGERDLLILATAAVVEGDVVTRDEGFPSAEGVAVLTWEQVADELDRGFGHADRHR